MKPTRAFWLWLALVLLLLFSRPVTALAAKDYWADRYDVHIQVQPDGALRVTETVVFHFEGGPFTFVYRDLEYNRIDQIEAIQAAMDGVPMQVGTGPGQVEIEASRPLKVTWHFAETSNSTHEFRLEYSVLGATRYAENSNRILWRAIPEEHEYPITQSEIVLEYPVELQPLSTPGLYNANGYTQSEAGRTVFLVDEIEENEPVDVEILFPAGSLIEQPPAWQVEEEQRQRERAAALPFGIGAGLATLAAGGLGLAALLLRGRRDDNTPLPYAMQQHTPPSDIPPALAARLTGSSNAAMAALFDLAQRGVLDIEMGRGGIFNTRQFSLVRNPQPTSLRPHEEGLLEALFEFRGSMRDRITFDELGGRLSSRAKMFTAPLEEEMDQRGWVDRERKSQRSLLIGLGVSGMLVGGVLAILGVLPFAAQLKAILIGVGAGLLLVGLVAAIAGAAYSTLTPLGMQEANAWQSFSKYLNDVTREREQPTRPDAMGLYLPFAAGFGLAASWARFFERNRDIPVPVWIANLQASGANINDVTAAIIASQSASSSSSGGAAGASGGGGSGAG